MAHHYSMYIYIYSGSSVRYEAVVSERLGRTSSKEQYAFLYRFGNARS